jgi:DNA-directed RNA polymerase subunit RPC12/RpoP
MLPKEFKEKPACSVKGMPVPMEVACPVCGSGIEIWTDEDETACRLCGHRIFSHEKTVN